jgi:hypothetical protein
LPSLSNGEGASPQGIYQPPMSGLMEVRPTGIFRASNGHCFIEIRETIVLIVVKVKGHGGEVGNGNSSLIQESAIALATKSSVVIRFIMLTY